MGDMTSVKSPKSYTNAMLIIPLLYHRVCANFTEN